MRSILVLLAIFSLTSGGLKLKPVPGVTPPDTQVQASEMVKTN